MPLNPEVEAARAQVFQLIGRNVLRFQRIELALKSTVAGSSVRVTEDTSPDVLTKHTVATNKKSMGLVAGEFFEEVVLDQPPPDSATVSAKEAKANGKVYIEISHKLHLPSEVHADWKVRLEKLIEERNDLVHTSLLKMNLETLEGCQQALPTLEAQATRVLAEIDRLKPIYANFVESQKLASELLADESFVKELFDK